MTTRIRPRVSTTRCRLRPVVRLPASKPRTSPPSLLLIDWASSTAADGAGSRPAAIRTWPRSSSWIRSQVPSRRTGRGLDAFTAYYNHHRPHRSLQHRATPATAWSARPKAAPGDRSADTHDRVRTDRTGPTGTVTLRHHGRLHHIGVGRTRAGTHILLLIQDLDIRIINAATGELLRQLTLDPTRNYQPTGRPPGPPPGTPRPPR